MRLLAASALLLSGCATASQPSGAMSVHELAKRHEELNGKVVRVRGVVKRCHSLSCGLHDPQYPERFISIGRSDAFARGIGPFLNREIVVEATLNDACVQDFDTEIIAICSDRPDSLQNPKIVWPPQ